MHFANAKESTEKEISLHAGDSAPNLHSKWCTFLHSFVSDHKLIASIPCWGKTSEKRATENWRSFYFVEGGRQEMSALTHESLLHSAAYLRIFDVPRARPRRLKYKLSRARLRWKRRDGRIMRRGENGFTFIRRATSYRFIVEHKTHQRDGEQFVVAGHGWIVRLPWRRQEAIWSVFYCIMMSVLRRARAVRHEWNSNSIYHPAVFGRWWTSDTGCEIAFVLLKKALN